MSSLCLPSGLRSLNGREVLEHFGAIPLGGSLEESELLSYCTLSCSLFKLLGLLAYKALRTGKDAWKSKPD